jgi:Flp pilus assembly protein TadG
MQGGRNGGRDERGLVAVEFMLVISMFIVVFLLMLQYAVQAQAQRVATAAAEEGLAAASAYDGSASDGTRVARGYLEALGPELHEASVHTDRSATTAALTVTGQVDQLVPFLPVRVRVEVEGPVERFIPESAGAQ